MSLETVEENDRSWSRIRNGLITPDKTSWQNFAGRNLNRVEGALAGSIRGNYFLVCSFVLEHIGINGNIKTEFVANRKCMADMRVWTGVDDEKRKSKSDSAIPNVPVPWNDAGSRVDNPGDGAVHYGST